MTNYDCVGKEDQPTRHVKCVSNCFDHFQERALSKDEACLLKANPDLGGSKCVNIQIFNSDKANEVNMLNVAHPFSA